MYFNGDSLVAVLLFADFAVVFCFELQSNEFRNRKHLPASSGPRGHKTT